MKTTFNSNSELCHVWAQQSQETGNANNLTFNSDSIYSYGYWIIAKFVKPSLVLFRDWSYSNSTGKQMSHARHALHSSVQVIYVNNPDSERESIEDLAKSVRASYNGFEGAHNKLNMHTVNQSALQTLTELSDLLGWNVPDLSNYDIEQEPAMLAIVEAYEERIEEKNKAKEDAKEADRLRIKEALSTPEADTARNEWRKGTRADHHIKLNGVHYSMFTEGPGLRLKGDEIHTSAGARVPVREAKILLERIRRGQDIRGFQIGYYKVISINGTLKIGCHEITREEIDIFCGLNNW